MESPANMRKWMSAYGGKKRWIPPKSLSIGFEQAPSMLFLFSAIYVPFPPCARGRKQMRADCSAAQFLGEPLLRARCALHHTLYTAMCAPLARERRLKHHRRSLSVSASALLRFLCVSTCVCPCHTIWRGFTFPRMWGYEQSCMFYSRLRQWSYRSPRVTLHCMFEYFRCSNTL